MKTQKMKNKLVLTKGTIVNLNPQELTQVNGGTGMVGTIDMPVSCKKTTTTLY